jgi:hypothetical protein
MKVTVTQTEVRYYEITKEVEMTAAEYKEYLKTGIAPVELVNELCSSTGDDCYTDTEILNTIIEKI